MLQLNTEQELEARRAYYRKNKDRIVAYQNAWYRRTHPDWRTRVPHPDPEISVHARLGQWIGHCGVWQEIEELPHTCTQCQDELLVIMP